VAAAERFLLARGVAAPLMVVRGDGALVSATFAKARPIETILSGPAASLVAAHYMTGRADAVVADVGGTTTHVAVLGGGRPRLCPEGALVGGFRTMVEAVAVHTFGLGGDSEVALELHGLA
jgi:N-methylhydantoinase A/oxoprolinase/acetone carboxylase beta subunit